MAWMIRTMAGMLKRRWPQIKHRCTQMKRRFEFYLCSAVFYLWLILFSFSAAAAERIVFLGDSITDGDTYPQLVRQALAEAGKNVPICINAGIGGDTAAGMLKRLDRDVFSRKPTLVTLSAGI